MRKGLSAVVVDLHGRGPSARGRPPGASSARRLPRAEAAVCDAGLVPVAVGHDEGAHQRADALHLGDGRGLRGREVGDRVPGGLRVVGVGHDVERLARHDALVGDERVVEVEHLAVDGVGVLVRGRASPARAPPRPGGPCGRPAPGSCSGPCRAGSPAACRSPAWVTLTIGSAFQRSGAARVASSHSVGSRPAIVSKPKARAPCTRLASSRAKLSRGFVRPPSWIAISRSGWSSGPPREDAAR